MTGELRRGSDLPAMSFPLPYPMRRALDLAAVAAEAGEVPVGAVITKGEEIVAEARNAMRGNLDPTAHAEMVAIRHAADALRSLPGVSVSRLGGAGGLTQVRIRGAEGNHTVVLIDGIEANASTSGEFDFSDLTAEDIERIEVIRGAQSSLYGSGAIGGVINIITRAGKGPLAISGYAEGGPATLV